jgi:co-chaperonin GroES (HSP10)
MKPTFNNVFVIEQEDAQTTDSGIILAGSAETGLKPGIVLAKGPECSTVKVGDVIYVKWSEAAAVTYKGKKGAMASETSILAVIE